MQLYEAFFHRYLKNAGHFAGVFWYFLLPLCLFLLLMLSSILDICFM